MTFTASINPMLPLNLLFPLQRVIRPQYRQSENYFLFNNSINLLTTILPNVKTLAYQLLVNIPPAQLRFPLLPVPEETPVPATRTFLFRDLLPAVPTCPLSQLLHLNESLRPGKDLLPAINRCR